MNSEDTPILEELHRRFVEKSGRTAEPFRFAATGWRELLKCPEYQGNVEKLWCDMAFVIWYLKKQIAAHVRRPGSLKLRNLLVPAKFLEDLGEASDTFSNAYRAHCVKFGKALAKAPQAARPFAVEPEQYNAHVFVWQIEEARLQRQSTTFGHL